MLLLNPYAVAVCPMFRLVDGAIQLTRENFTAGTVANYICNANFELVGKGTAVCQENGFWSAEVPICRGIHNDTFWRRKGGLEGLEPPSNHRPNYMSSSATIRLALDIPLFRIHVVDLFYWGSMPPDHRTPRWCTLHVSYCIFFVVFFTAVRCEILQNPMFGGVQTDLQNSVGSRATYFCNSNFRLTNGDQFRMCLEDGNWTGMEPECSKSQIVIGMWTDTGLEF